MKAIMRNVLSWVVNSTNQLPDVLFRVVNSTKRSPDVLFRVANSTNSISFCVIDCIGSLHSIFVIAEEKPAVGIPVALAPKI